MLSRYLGFLLSCFLLVGPAWGGVLHHAAAEGDIEALRAGIQTGADLDASDRRGMTPLHKAAANGQLKSIKLLLRKGADPEIKNRDGRTVLEFAKELGQTDVVDLLESWASAEEEEDDEDCD